MPSAAQCSTTAALPRPPTTKNEEVDTDMTNTFLYFAYGSNLLAQRIHLNNPTAVRKTIGKLKNYRLDFNHWAERWRGCVATIVPDDSKHVWGAVWEIDSSNMPNLDRQEGVNEGIYFPLQVLVETPGGQELSCRSYQLHDTPPALREGEKLPSSRCPSQIYFEVIIQGACESDLPPDYISALKKIPHNGYKGDIDVNINIPLDLQ